MKYTLNFIFLNTVFLLMYGDTIGQTELNSVSGSSFTFKGIDPLELFQNGDSW